MKNKVVSEKMAPKNFKLWSREGWGPWERRTRSRPRPCRVASPCRRLAVVPCFDVCLVFRLPLYCCPPCSFVPLCLPLSPPLSFASFYICVSVFRRAGRTVECYILFFCNIETDIGIFVPMLWVMSRPYCAVLACAAVLAGTRRG